MSTRTNDEMQELEEKLLKAKYRDPSKYNTTEDEDIVIDAYNAMSQIEKKGYLELVKYLHYFLDDPDAYLRERAISAFGGFRVDEVLEARDKAFTMWNNQHEDEYVRFLALGIWDGFFRDTCDKRTLEILYNLLCNKSAIISLRIQALAGIYDVSGNLTNELGYWILDLINRQNELKDPKIFHDAIDWNAINTIMKKYAPEALINSSGKH